MATYKVTQTGAQIQADLNKVENLADIRTTGTGINLTGNQISVDTSIIATKTDLAGKQDTISDLSTIRSGAALGATAVQPETGKGLFSGNYNDLLNKPTIPTKTSDLTNDAKFVNETTLEATDAIAKEAHSMAEEAIALGERVGEVAAEADVRSQDAIQGLDYKQNKIDSSNKLSASLIDGLSTVATSGSYNDLSNKPTIPDVAAKMDKENPTGFGSFSLNRRSDTSIGSCSFTEGYDNTASGNYSHAEGGSTTASGDFSHAEGYETTAEGYYSHAEGETTTASGDCAHAEGESTTASGDYSHAEGIQTTASGYASHAEGSYTTASGDYSHAEGYNTTASDSISHTEGSSTTASGINSHAEGESTTANHASQHVFGAYNTIDDFIGEPYERGNYIEIVGNGFISSRSNARTLDWNGNEVLAGTITPSGSDYCEYFEWKDGNKKNEDRMGYIVTLDGDKIIKANETDDILGITTTTKGVIGDAAEMNWSEKYERDNLGRIIYEDQEIEHEQIIQHHEAEINYVEEQKDEEGNIIVEAHEEIIKEAYDEVIREAYVETIKVPKISEKFDPDKEYIPRSQRKEWYPVGLLGKVYTRQDGNLKIGDYVVAKNGMAIKSETKTNLRVLEIIDSEVVRIIIK